MSRVLRAAFAAGALCASGLFASSGAYAQTPLDQPGSNYLGQFPLGLYPGGNKLPAAHRAEGIERANQVQRLDTSGAPNASGEIVVLSIGGLDTSQEFCTGSLNNPPERTGMDLRCTGHSLIGRLMRNGGFVETASSAVTYANGAYGDQYAPNWEVNTTPFANIPANGSIPLVTGNYDRIRDNVLGRYTVPLTEAQVQVVWLKVSNQSPSVSLPSASADAYALEVSLGNIVRLLKARYPNLLMVFLSSKDYGGYATNGEPFAYETGFAVKWLIEAQINQMTSGVIDARAGNLNYDNGTAPWLAWGPYLWTDGTAGKPDSPNWVPQDFDATAPSFSTVKTVQGQSKTAFALLRFLTLSPFTKCWFKTWGTCQ